MAWHIIEKLLEEIAKHSTFVGKVWITAIFLFRIVVVTRICDTVYHDEQAAFRCNIKQPGCENVCFNKFSPISHVRFWGFEIIAVSLPSIIFIVFAAHEVARKFSKGLGSSNNQKFGTVKGPIGRIGQKILSEEADPRSDDMTESKKLGLNFIVVFARAIKKILLNANSGRNIRFSKRQTPRDRRELEIKRIEVRLCRAYIIQSVARALLEIMFAYLQYRLFGFVVEEKYLCTGWPCPNNVDCFISRPKEKTLLLYFMFTVSCFCIFLNFIEIYSFIQYSIRRRYRRRVSGRGKSVRIADFEPSHIVRRYSVDHTLDDHAEEKKENDGYPTTPSNAKRVLLKGKALSVKDDEDDRESWSNSDCDSDRNGHYRIKPGADGFI